MYKLLFAGGIVATMTIPFAVCAAIYKSVDENGNVTYSDTPSPDAVEIEKRQIPTVPARLPQMDRSSTDGKTGNTEDSGQYESIAIASPENDTAVRENSGNLTVNVTLKPALAPAHEIVLYMDGKQAARSRSAVFRFSNLDRGTHTLAAAVVSREGDELIRSDSISFTLLRHSRLHPEVTTPAGPTPTPSGPTPTNPPTGSPSGQNPVNPTFPGPTPTNPPKPTP